MYEFIYITIVLIIIVLIIARGRRESLDNIDSLIVDITRAGMHRESVLSFVKKHKNITPYQFAQLSALWSDGKLTRANVSRVIAK